MRKFYTQLRVFVLTLLIGLPLFNVMQLIPNVEAEQGTAKVYVLQLTGVGVAWVNDPSQVTEGAIEASTPTGKHKNIPRAHPKYGQTAPFYSITYQMITSWSTYVHVILNQVGVIVVNTHGELLPVPSAYTKEVWLDTIAEAMTYRRLTWAHVGGYPFYYVWYEGASDKTSWGVNGFKALMGHIGLGNVELWPPESGLKAETTGEAAQYLNIGGWPNFATYAYEVGLSRPLKKSDFAGCTILPLYKRVHDSEVYWEGAIIAFAKPGARLDAAETEGFGSFVHLGTDQTYDVNDNPTNRDYSCGYVATAAAIWTEALGFESYNAFNSNNDPTYPNDVSLHVAPVIAGYWWEPGGTFSVRIVLGLYGALKAHETDDAHTTREVGIILKNVPVDTQMQAKLDISKNGEEAGTKLEGLWEEGPYDRYLGLITPTVLWVLPLVCPGTAPFVAIANGIILFSKWTLPIDQRITYPGDGVNAPASTIQFCYDPVRTYTYEGDYRYEEFQSLIAIDVYVPASGRSDWRVIPVDFWVKLFTWSGIDVEVEAGLSMAMWFDPSNNVMVFFEDFEEDMSEWSVEDNRSAAGYDYWGTSTVQAHTAWCAQVGHNSITETSNVEAGQYDKGMDAYLTRDIDLRPYKSAELSYYVDYWILAGDELLVQYYANDSWLNLVPSYTNGMDARYEKNVSVPICAQKIGFRFVSNNDDDVAWGAFIDNVQITAIIPNDAINQSIDAGNDFNSATEIGVSESTKNYAGYLDEEYQDDFQDWYRLYVESGQRIWVILHSPPSADFDLEVYSPSDPDGEKAGPGDYVDVYANETGYWVMKIYIVSGFGQYSFDIAVYTPPSGGAGCPFVSTWNATHYVLDNNLLASSEASNGSDVVDYYMLQQPLVPYGDGVYRLLLTEFEQEHDFFDQVGLLAVDHQPNANVAISPYGEILTYTNPYPAVSAITNDNENVKLLLSAIDGDYYEGNNGSHIILNFGDDLDLSDGAKLVMRADFDRKVPYSIHVQVQDESNNWNTVAAVIPRVYWATEIIDLSEYLPDPKGNLKTRLYFTANHKIDFLGLDTSSQAIIDSHGGQLISAVHSTIGEVTTQLLSSDETYAELVPEQEIVLTFTLPSQTMETRSYIIITEGHYHTIT